VSVFLEEDQQVLHVFQKKYFRRDERNILHKRTTFALLLYFHFGECFWASGIPPSLYSLPTQPSSFYKKKTKNKTEREKQKETFMAHHPSQFMILFLLLSL
jgi:hypothetical protein